MSAVFESIAPPVVPKWGYESVVPVAPISGSGTVSWVHGLGDTPTELYAFLRVKMFDSTHWYLTGVVLPLELNRDGDVGRNHTFTATSSRIILNQGNTMRLTRSIYTSDTFAVRSTHFALFVKARI